MRRCEECLSQGLPFEVQAETDEADRGRITSAPWLSTTGKAAHGVRLRLAIWTGLQEEGRPKPGHYRGFTRVRSATPSRQWVLNCLSSAS